MSEMRDASLTMCIYAEENPQSQRSMTRWRATFDDNFVTWGYGATPDAAAINLLGRYRWDAQAEALDLRESKAGASEGG